MSEAYYETFNNCREQGLVLKIYNNKTNLYIWACQCRISDDIMIVLGNEKDCDRNNMFSDEAFNRTKYFDCNKYDDAVDYVYKHIKYMFKDSINTKRHFKFNSYKSIDDIRRIQIDAKDLQYEDYYELASFFDEDEMYSCDLIILDGQFGYRYNKHTSDGIENLKFEEVNSDLENEITLMVDMSNKLNNFITEELNYSIQMDNSNVRI